MINFLMMMITNINRNREDFSISMFSYICFVQFEVSKLDLKSQNHICGHTSHFILML